ncbi:MarR family winged helix-turn-helix transcriptional regulator [Hirschia maritima]|uniref:MarR family winged helix-turn-helix transcriptional regulator n=1 Tax=Hirschia maritima TaxID=1121961 RepID=UPI000378B894|nr:MarR family transcriptional regulator [Hirschia maritima]
MKSKLGTQLRHIIELLDGAVADSYEKSGLDYRPRYTPVMKALIQLKTCTISEIATHAKITQPAATQTVKLMAKANLISITKSEKDGRERLIGMTDYAKSITPQLQNHWTFTQQAAASLDNDLGYSFSEILNQVTQALAQKDFAARIQEAQQNSKLEDQTEQ